MSAKDRYFSGEHKKTIGIILAAVAILIIATIVWGMRQSKDNKLSLAASTQNADFQTDVVYYFAEQCTRCKNVEKFIADNKISDKISFAKKEVLLDQVNDMEMKERARECTLDPDKVGVPFLWARGKCYVGEVEVQKFLKNEIEME